MALGRIVATFWPKVSPFPNHIVENDPPQKKTPKCAKIQCWLVLESSYFPQDRHYCCCFFNDQKCRVTLLGYTALGSGCSAKMRPDCPLVGANVHGNAVVFDQPAAWHLGFSQEALEYGLNMSASA